jgi:hypothetical protein
MNAQHPVQAKISGLNTLLYFGQATMRSRVSMMPEAQPWRQPER